MDLNDPFTKAKVYLESEQAFYKAYVATRLSNDRFDLITLWIDKSNMAGRFTGYVKWDLVDYFDDLYHGELYTNGARFRPAKSVQGNIVLPPNVEQALILLKNNVVFCNKYRMLLAIGSTVTAQLRDYIRATIDSESKFLYESLKFKGDHTDSAENIRIALGNYFATLPPPVEETLPMSNTFFQEKKFLNGKDIATMSNAEIYACIAAKEAEIAKLESMKTQLKRTQKEIADHKADLNQLVQHLDSLDSEPTV